MARESVVKVRDAQDGCAVFAISAVSKGVKLGPSEHVLPTRKASFATFVKSMGGESEVRKLCMDAKIIKIQAAMRANGTASAAVESDLD